MNRIKILSIFVLVVLLLSASLSTALSQEPKGWWATTNPYRWEYVEGGHWLAVWSGTHGYDQHFVPGDWQTCFSGYGCIDSWTWWLLYPESKLGVPSTWRSVWPGAKNLNNYIATCWYY
jgi:hypothetical protein